MFVFKKLLLSLTLVVIVINSSESLQCFVCSKQDQLEGKCTQTVKICNSEADVKEDTCLTEIRYGPPPYWTEEVIKQIYVTKGCSNRAACESLKTKTIRSCTYKSDKDWRCIECCFEDECNQYITMGSSAVKSNILVLIGCVTILIGFQLHYNYCF